MKQCWVQVWGRGGLGQGLVWGRGGLGQGVVWGRGGLGLQRSLPCQKHALSSQSFWWGEKTDSGSLDSMHKNINRWSSTTKLSA